MHITTTVTLDETDIKKAVAYYLQMQHKYDVNYNDVKFIFAKDNPQGSIAGDRVGVVLNIE